MNGVFIFTSYLYGLEHITSFDCSVLLFVTFCLRLSTCFMVYQVQHDVISTLCLYAYWIRKAEVIYVLCLNYHEKSGAEPVI